MTSEQSPDEQNPGGPSPDDSTGGVTDADHAAPDAAAVDDAGRSDDTAVTETTDDAVEPDEAAPKAAARSKIEAKRAAREAEAAGAPAGGREFTVTARSLVRAGIGLLVICALVAIGLLSWQYVEKSRTLSAFGDSKAAASSFVKTYFETMMAPNATPEQIQAKIKPLTTGEARARVENDSKSTVQFVKEGKFANMTVEVTSTSVQQFTADSATAIVGMTLSGTSATAPAGGKQAVLFEVDLVKKDGKWLVGKMASEEGVTAGADGGSSMVPTTTPPAGDTTPPAGQTPAPQPAG
ncbi:hypothetical protein [Gordonia sp. (in: high G+C Gram-positive bacteria)]|uniref:hypothetical protein n=1 Tax=Gordonia sp. (in: high G+C Gram-positive bacteria) TaxID=84139 RepID=UPI0035293A2F